MQEWDEPAPIYGMDTTLPLFNMPKGFAYALYNLIPSAYGCESRPGYQNWNTPFSGETEARTLMPYNRGTRDLSANRLYKATKEGIYEITLPGIGAPLRHTFTNQAGDAGFLSYVQFTNANTIEFLFFADEENGLFRQQDTAIVVNPTDITFPGSPAVTSADISFVTSYKGRLWFVPRNSSDAYYLPVGAVSGATTKFQFGAKMSQGGNLVGLWDWSLDGGDGIDDYLVAIGRNGDVLVYQGTDPAQSSTWALVGRWEIGGIPKGRRIAGEIGGDLYILSAFGLTSLKSLLAGTSVLTADARGAANKISYFIRSLMATRKEVIGWKVLTLPEEGKLVILIPTLTGESHLQLVLNLHQLGPDRGAAWGLWRDLPVLDMVAWKGLTYFSTPYAVDSAEKLQYNVVAFMKGSIDALNLNGNVIPGISQPIKFAVVGRYSPLEAPGRYKQVQFLRPQLVTTSSLSYSCVPLYDYDLQEGPSLIGIQAGTGSVWDTAIWDSNVWSGIFTAQVLSGGSGYGTQVATYLKGEAWGKVNYISLAGAHTTWAFL